MSIYWHISGWVMRLIRENNHITLEISPEEASTIVHDVTYENNHTKVTKQLFYLLSQISKEQEGNDSNGRSTEVPDK